MSSERIVYSYRFRFPDGKTIHHEVRLDQQALELVPRPRFDHPDWTLLGFRQCSNCPLDTEEVERCPAAAGLLDLTDEFEGRMSYDEVFLEVRTPQRTSSGRTSLQDALRSLMGIYLACAGCPHLDRLRPMVRFHLPLASPEETTFRAVGTYLVGQYLLAKEGGEPDWDLEGLKETYAEVHEVNVAFTDRLAAASTGDAGLNSLVRLDLFTHLVPEAIRSDLRQFAPLFESARRSGTG